MLHTTLHRWAAQAETEPTRSYDLHHVPMAVIDGRELRLRRRLSGTTEIHALFGVHCANQNAVIVSLFISCTERYKERCTR